MLERKKFCPVCGGLAAVLDGNPNEYGDKAVPWNTFIRVKYDCNECRAIMKGQSTRLSNKRRRKERREQATVLLDVVSAYRERVALLERENRLSRQRVAELERAARTQ